MEAEDEGYFLPGWQLGSKFTWMSKFQYVSKGYLNYTTVGKIQHQLIGSISHYSQGFIHPRWCRISSINSMTHDPWYGIFWWLPGWKPWACLRIWQAFKTHTHHVTSDTDAGNPIRKARDHEIIWIYDDICGLFQTHTHRGFILNDCVVLVVSRWGRRGWWLNTIIRKPPMCLVFSKPLQILLWSNLIRFHPRLTDPSQVVSMMEKMVGDLVGEQFAKNQAHSSLSVGFQVTWQIRSKVGGYTQSSTRSIKNCKFIGLRSMSNISMTQWHWISGILLSHISDQGQEDWGGRQIRRRSLWEVWVQSLVMDVVTWWHGDMDRKSRIACREHSWWKVSETWNCLNWNGIEDSIYDYICLIYEKHREQR